jgi:hypothetical protein
MNARLLEPLLVVITAQHSLVMTESILNSLKSSSMLVTRGALFPGSFVGRTFNDLYRVTFHVNQLVQS